MTIANSGDKLQGVNNSTPFAPVSRHVIPSGAHARMRDWIILGVLNGLVVALSHLIFSLYVFLGPAAIVMSFFHQSVENLLLAAVYLLMASTAPHRSPFTLNAMVWSIIGLMQGWWMLIPVVVPAGLFVDWVIRRAALQRRMGWMIPGFAFYTTMLSAGGCWPYLFLKKSAMVQRMTAMDPCLAAMVDNFTLPFFAATLSVTFVTGLLGGYMGLKLIARHFAANQG